MTRPRLITIPFSHFCEKARWALERAAVEYDEEGHLPIFHYASVRRVSRTSTVPVLVAGDVVLSDSTEILRWIDRRATRARRLYPDDPAARTDVEALEDIFDNKLGPATRLWGYSHILPKRALMLQVASRDVPSSERRWLRLGLPIATRLIRRKLRLNSASVERSIAHIDSIFTLVRERLADGRPFLTGERFTAADLTFAALAGPAVLPSRLTVYDGLLQLPRARRAVERWREQPAGQFATRLYETQRAAAPTA